MKERKNDDSVVYSVEHEDGQNTVYVRMKFPPDYFTPIFRYARAFAEVHEIADAPIRVVIEEADASSAKWLETMILGECLNGHNIQGICKKVYAADELITVAVPMRRTLYPQDDYLRRAA